MHNFFVGMLLVFLDFSIKFGSAEQYIINLIPDFLGYIFILKGINEMMRESAVFDRAIKPAKTLVAFGIIAFVANAAGVADRHENISSIGAFIMLVFEIKLWFRIIEGIEDVERNRNIFLNSPELRRVWKILAVIKVVVALWTMLAITVLAGSIFAGAVTGLNTALALGGITAVIAAVAIVIFAITLLVYHIKFLIRLRKADKLYEEYTSRYIEAE